MKNKIKIDLSRTWLTWSLIQPGVTMYALMHQEYPGPIGLVWGVRIGGKKTKFDVFGSFVPYFARRQGVRTKLNAEIFRAKQADLVYSGVTHKDGEKFMRATGYKYNAEMDYWILEKPPVPLKKKK